MCSEENDGSKFASEGKPGASEFLGNRYCLFLRLTNFLGTLWFLLLAEAPTLTRNLRTGLFSFAALSRCFVPRVHCVSITFYRKTREMSTQQVMAPEHAGGERDRNPFHVLKEILLPAPKRHMYCFLLLGLLSVRELALNIHTYTHKYRWWAMEKWGLLESWVSTLNKSIWTVTELFHRDADAMHTLVFFV